MANSPRFLPSRSLLPAQSLCCDADHVLTERHRTNRRTAQKRRRKDVAYAALDRSAGSATETVSAAGGRRRVTSRMPSSVISTAPLRQRRTRPFSASTSRTSSGTLTRSNNVLLGWLSRIRFSQSACSSLSSCKYNACTANTPRFRQRTCCTEPAALRCDPDHTSRHRMFGTRKFTTGAKPFLS